LRQRLTHLTLEEAQAGGVREVVQKHGLPRLLWVEEEYRDRVRAAEIDFVRSLLADIQSGALEGGEWWQDVHRRGFDKVPPPFDPAQLLELHQQLDQIAPDIDEDQP
jgi:hypothetical protein